VLPSAAQQPPTKEHAMGKYVLAWILGVPAIVVVAAYLIFH
jgi:hypothetical protein